MKIYFFHKSLIINDFASAYILYHYQKFMDYDFFQKGLKSKKMSEKRRF